MDVCEEMALNDVMFHSGNFRRRIKKWVASLSKEIIETFPNLRR